MASLWNDSLMKWWAYEKTSCWQQPVDEMTGWWDYPMMKWLVNTMTNGKEATVNRALDGNTYPT